MIRVERYKVLAGDKGESTSEFKKEVTQMLYKRGVKPTLFQTLCDRKPREFKNIRIAENVFRFPDMVSLVCQGEYAFLVPRERNAMELHRLHLSMQFADAPFRILALLGVERVYTFF